MRISVPVGIALVGGAATLTLATSPVHAQQVDASRLPFGQEVRSELRTADEVARYTFLSAGHDSVVVRVRFASEGNGETVSLSGPHGEEVPIEPGATPLSAPGAYTLLVSRLSGSAPAAFSVGVYRFRSGVETGVSTLVPGAVVEGELEYQGDVDTFTFQGQAGQRIVLQARELGGPTPNVWVIAELLPWGPPRFGDLPLPHTNSFGSDLASTSSEPFRLDHTGGYRVQVKETDVSSTWTGRYQVRLRIIQ